MNEQRKLVSIGMPVYNGGRFIELTLESLLNQDYKNFELIICDNASTDSTEDICRKYAAKDKRIEYVRNKENFGMARNFILSFERSVGEYFMWASDHDLWDKSFIARCAEVLHTDLCTALVFPTTVFIDLEGRELEVADDTHLDTRVARDPAKRFLRVMRGYKQGNIIQGLIRSSTLRKTRLVLDLVGADRLLLAELSLLGAFAHVDAPLFYRRKQRPYEGSEQRKKRWLETIAPNMNKKFPRTILMWNHFIAVKRSSLSPLSKLTLGASILGFFYKSFGVELMAFLCIHGLYKSLKKTIKKGAL